MLRSFAAENALLSFVSRAYEKNIDAEFWRVRISESIRGPENASVSDINSGMFLRGICESEEAKADDREMDRARRKVRACMVLVV